MFVADSHSVTHDQLHAVFENTYFFSFQKNMTFYVFGNGVSINVKSHNIKFAECLWKYWPQNSGVLWVLIGVYHTQFSVA